MISIIALVLVISIGFIVPKAGGWRIGLASCFQSLLVLIVEGTVPGERAAADSCVRSRSCKVVRRNGRAHASRVD